MTTRLASWTALLLVAVAATSCGANPKPSLLSASNITGTLTEDKAFMPTAIGPCDMESKTVLHGVKASDFKAWNRTVEGHHELLVVGLWPEKQQAAEKQLQDLAHAVVTCDQSKNSNGYMIQGSDNGAPGRPEWAGGLSVFRYQRDSLIDVTRFYTWADGYMVTAWGQTTDSDRTYGDLRKVMDAQLQKVAVASKS